MSQLELLEAAEVQPLIDEALQVLQEVGVLVECERARSQEATPMIHASAQFCPQNHPCPVTRQCPTGAISQQGFGLPIIDEALCTGCGRCARSCPSFSFAEPRARSQVRAAK